MAPRAVLVLVVLTFGLGAIGGANSIAIAGGESTTPVDLGTLGGTASEATGINNNGWIVGNSEVKDHYSHTYGSASRAFVWHEGRMQDLGSLGGGSSHVASVDNDQGDTFAGSPINDRGTIAGWSRIGRHDEYGDYTTEHAFVWSGGKLYDLGTLGGANSRALTLNANGAVIGESQPKGKNGQTEYFGDTLTFIWTTGRMRSIWLRTGDTTWPVGITSQGDVFGTSELGENYQDFLWSDGRVRSLAPYFADVINDRGEAFGSNGRYWALLQGGRLKQAGRLQRDLREFSAIAMNNAGQVVGYCVTRKNNAARPCRWQQGTITLLPSLPQSTIGRALDINERGQIVGRMQTFRAGSSIGIAVMWANGMIRTLPGLGGLSAAALAINDHGDVVGWSTTSNGQRHATLWKAHLR